MYIRRAKETDMPGINNLLRQVLMVHHNGRPDLFKPEARKYTDDQLVIITTGSQGEPMSALSRMASGNHRKVSVGYNDCVIISARPIPGNEKTVYKVINDLLRLGAQVIYEKHGADKMLFGTDTPWHTAKMEMRLLDSLDISQSDKEKIFYKNEPKVLPEVLTALKEADLSVIAVGKIKDIFDMTPFSLATIVSTGYVRYALEVPQGWFSKNGIVVGDYLDLSPLKN